MPFPVSTNASVAVGPSEALRLGHGGIGYVAQMLNGDTVDELSVIL